MTMWILIAVLMAVGLYGIFAKRQLLKKILGLVVVEYAVNLFLVSVGYRDGVGDPPGPGGPPILTPGVDPSTFVASSVDPLPQALVLTSIVIGLGVLMLLVALALRAEERYGTLDTSEMNRLRG